MNRTTRPESWLPLFYRLLEEHRNMPFQYGVHDCATIVAKLKVLSSPIPIGIPSWSNTAEALRLLQGKSLLLWALEVLGEPIPWGSCIVGDVAIAKRETEDPNLHYQLCVFDGFNFLSPSDVRGFSRVFESTLLLGWRM